MIYNIELTKASIKFLKQADKPTREHIEKAIDKLTSDPLKQSNIKKMQGYDRTYRKRLGNIRIIFEIHEQKILIVITKIGFRGDVYK
jgi:mRNA interferase RelE/StbE